MSASLNRAVAGTDQEGLAKPVAVRLKKSLRLHERDHQTQGTHYVLEETKSRRFIRLGPAEARFVYQLMLNQAVSSSCNPRKRIY